MSKQDSRHKAARILAEITGREADEFDPDLEAYPLPDPDDLESESADEFYGIDE